MTRYIDAELIEKYISREEHNTPDEKWRPESEFAALIDNIPTADVVEVVHGRWIEKEKYTFGIMYDCSLCENRILDNGHPWNYCPNCGAKMDGKKVE